MTTSRSSALLVVSALTLLASAAAQAATVRGFEGSFLLDLPTPTGAVGSTQFMESNADSVAVYDKATGALSSRVDPAIFWAAAGSPAASYYGPQVVLFDHYTDRWLAVGARSTAGNILTIGVSDTANALGGWKSVSVTVLPSGLADFPTLGIDAKGVYIGTNNFTPDSDFNRFNGTSLLSIPKASLFGSAAPSTAGMTTFSTPFPASADRGLTIQAAVKWDGNATNSAAVIAESRDEYEHIFYKLNGVDGPGATQGATHIVAGLGYTQAGPARQPDGTRNVQTLSGTITTNAVQVGDRLYSVSTIRGANDYADVRWSVVNANTGSLIATGAIDAGDYDYYLGSIAVNEFGQAVIGYNRSGLQLTDSNGDGKADGTISFMAQAFDVDATGALVAQGSEILLRASDVNNLDGRLVSRSAVTINPSNHHSFYAIGTYAAALSRYSERHTYVGEIDMTAAVPEPSSYALMAVGLVFVGGMARRRKAA